MAKEIKSYQCEHCGKIHPDLAEAQKCENDGHKIPLSIEAVYYFEGANYPSGLDICFENDEIKRYRIQNA